MKSFKEILHELYACLGKANEINKIVVLEELDKMEKKLHLKISQRKISLDDIPEADNEYL